MTRELDRRSWLTLSVTACASMLSACARRDNLTPASVPARTKRVARRHSPSDGSSVVPQEDVVHIREALPPDAEVVRHALERFRRSNARHVDAFLGGPATLHETRAMLRQHAESPDQAFFVAEVGSGRAVGLLDCTTDTLGRATLSVWVDHDWRGHGIASEMMGLLVEWARDNHRVHELRLTVFCDNAPALRLYEKHGFTPAAAPRLFTRRHGADVYDQQMVLPV